MIVDTEHSEHARQGNEMHLEKIGEKRKLLPEKQQYKQLDKAMPKHCPK